MSALEKEALALCARCESLRTQLYAARAAAIRWQREAMKARKAAGLSGNAAAALYRAAVVGS